MPPPDLRAGDGEQIEALLGAFDTTNPLYILAVYAPAFATFLLVLRYHGVRGLLSYLRRLTLVIWGVLHLPAFLFSDTPHGAWALGPFFGGTIAASDILTAVFNATRGSLLIAALFHSQLMNPVFPGARPWANLTLALVDSGQETLGVGTTAWWFCRVVIRCA